MSGQPSPRILVVSPPGPARDDLKKVMSEALFEIAVVTPDPLTGAVSAQSLDEQAAVDLLLVAASIGVPEVAVVSSGMVRSGRAPAVVVFPDDPPPGDTGRISVGIDQLEEAVLAGYDYIVPPFRASFLRSRMTIGSERRRILNLQEQHRISVSLQEYQHELSIAREIQAGFLPDELPTQEGWQLAARFHPAKQVAGDFYDAFELVHGDRLGMVVADVCDKGVGAALFMALIRTLLRHTAQHADVSSSIDAELAADLASSVDVDLVDEVAVEAGIEAAEVEADLETVQVTLPEAEQEIEAAMGMSGAAVPAVPKGAAPLVQAVVGTNRYLTRNHLHQGYFATMFFAVLDPPTGEVLYINGGHNPPVLRRAGGEQTTLQPTGPAVGMLPDGEFSLGHVHLEPGDVLFVYSDGVVEARSHDGEMFGMQRMVDAIVAAASQDSDHVAEDVAGGVDAAVKQHVASAEQFDDITMMVLRRDVA